MNFFCFCAITPCSLFSLSLSISLSLLPASLYLSLSLSVSLISLLRQCCLKACSLSHTFLFLTFLSSNIVDCCFYNWWRHLSPLMRVLTSCLLFSLSLSPFSCLLFHQWFCMLALSLCPSPYCSYCCIVILPSSSLSLSFAHWLAWTMHFHPLFSFPLSWMWRCDRSNDDMIKVSSHA